jgi:hypothetical protein
MWHHTFNMRVACSTCTTGAAQGIDFCYIQTNSCQSPLTCASVACQHNSFSWIWAVTHGDATLYNLAADL